MAELPLWTLGIGAGVLCLLAVTVWIARQRPLKTELEYIEAYRMRTRRREKTRTPGRGT